MYPIKCLSSENKEAKPITFLCIYFSMGCKNMQLPYILCCTSRLFMSPKHMEMSRVD